MIAMDMIAFKSEKLSSAVTRPAEVVGYNRKEKGHQNRQNFCQWELTLSVYLNLEN